MFWWCATGSNHAPNLASQTLYRFATLRSECELVKRLACETAKARADLAYWYKSSKFRLTCL